MTPVNSFKKMENARNNENGQKKYEFHHKNGKLEGLWTEWHENGQKKGEGHYKDGKLETIVVWKSNGEKCPDTNVVNGNGVVVSYNDDGTEDSRYTYKDGEEVR